MVQKRPFTGELFEISSKHPRQFDHSDHLVSFLEFPCKGVGWKPNTSVDLSNYVIGEGKDGFTRSIREHDREPESVNITEISKEDTENSSPGGISNSSSASSYASEEDVRLEVPFHILVSPKYYDSDQPTKTLVHSEDIYTSYLEHHPQKLVSIGPGFQADVPEWCSHGAKNTSVYSDSAETSTLYSQAYGSNLDDYLNVENKFSGTCVIPMPEEEPHACNDDRIGDCRIICCCEYPGSFKCVRQHIVEARENLKRAVGQERFVGLGFCDMGDIVAEKWCDEDQQLFQEVVFSNPSSAGNNFWDHLYAVFPSRTKTEIVSYYFNVFMLRRRAQQNRCDSMNIDSDDDEWQESDGEFESSGEDEVSEKDEDSVVKLPICQGVPGWSEIHDDHSHEYVSGIVSAFSHHYDLDFIGGTKGIANVPETFPEKVLNNYRADPMFQSSEQTLLDEMGDHDINDHSCTSADTGSEDSEPQASQLRVEYCKSFTAPFNGASAEGGHEFLLEPCDAKVWDVGYLTCPRNDVEFLPTCSMIEEVFGVGSWK